MSTLNHYATEFNNPKINDLVVPHRRVEDWKYTNPKSYLERNYRVYKASELTESSDIDSKNFKQIFIQGEKISIPEEIAGLKDSSDTLKQSTYFENDFMASWKNELPSVTHSFAIDKDIDSPIMIHLMNHNTKSTLNTELAFTIAKSKSAKILVNIINANENNNNITYNAHLAENSNLELVVLNKGNTDSLTLQSINAHVDKNACFSNVMINTAQGMSRSNIYINLHGENSNCDAHGLYLQNKNSHHDTLSYIHHSHAHTESRQVYKGILADNARGVFTGRVRIEQDSQLVNAEQLNKNLLLSKKAQAYSRPQLEIYADDVKCAHGSTTGQLSDQELFYFESRGIRKERARELLAKAFANDVIFKIKSTDIRNIVQEYIDKLEGDFYA